MRQPWERIPKKGKRPAEPDAGYQDFRAYLDLGINRRIEDAAALTQSAHSPHLNKRPDYLRKISAKWGWVARASAYDDHLAALARKGYEQRHAALGRRRAELEFSLQERMEKLVEKLEAKMNDLIKLPSVGIEQQKSSAAGEITITKAQGLRPADLAVFSKEIREAARDALNGLRPPAASEKGKLPLRSSNGTFTYVKPKHKPTETKRLLPRATDKD